MTYLTSHQFNKLREFTEDPLSPSGVLENPWATYANLGSAWYSYTGAQIKNLIADIVTTRGGGTTLSVFSRYGVSTVDTGLLSDSVEYAVITLLNKPVSTHVGTPAQWHSRVLERILVDILNLSSYETSYPGNEWNAYRWYQSLGILGLDLPDIDTYPGVIIRSASYDVPYFDAYILMAVDGPGVDAVIAKLATMPDYTPSGNNLDEGVGCRLLPPLTLRGSSFYDS